MGPVADPHQLMKILVSDKLAPEGLAILEAQKEFQVDVRNGMSPDELKKVIGEYDAIIIRSATTLTGDIIDAGAKLKVIGRAGVGLDNVDLPASTKKGVVAMNTPGGNTTSTAEHTLSMMLALSRNIPQACAAMRAGRWDRSQFSGVELHGKTLGIIGLGRIGSTVSRYAKAFGMQVLAYDPYLSMEAIQQQGVAAGPLERLYENSDYISVHIPKTAETENLIGATEIAKMKPGVRLINCARGGIIDEAALDEALASGRIAGAALDVFAEEPLAADSPLRGRENCVLTPHLGASTSEAQVNVAIEIAECVRDALMGRGIVNAVNFPSVDGETYRQLEPYIHLGFCMGKFAGQLINGRISEVKITYNGILTRYKTAPVTLSLVNGLLTPILEDRVNYVNALDVARERAIAVQEITSTRDEEFTNCVKVEIETDKIPFLMMGTLSGNNLPRIVRINQTYMEAIPEGNILFIHNNDKPGMVGAIGATLGEGQVNIAGITLGRRTDTGTAISVINVDSEVPEAVVERLKQIPDILYVRAMKV